MSPTEKLTKWLKAYAENGYLNGAMLISVGGELIVNDGFGMANWEHRVPNTKATKFRIGSLTKSFTAAAIFQLYKKQAVDLHDPIGKYVEGVPNGDFITIYHCLTHTSGIPDFAAAPDFWAKTMRLPSTLGQLLESIKKREPGFPPGVEFEYSNSNYSILTAIIEEASGLTYRDYLQEHICGPLAMENTGCDDGTKLIPFLASGYTFWEEPLLAAYADMSFPLGAYGMYSTVGDLFTWQCALLSDDFLDGRLKEIMFKPNLEGYACGWMVSEISGKRCLNHFGDVSGYFSDFLTFPDEDMAIIFLSNMNITPVTHLTRQAANILFGGDAACPAPLAPVKIEDAIDYVGTFSLENRPGMPLTVYLEKEALYLTVPKMYGVPYKFKLIPIHNDREATVFATEMVNEQIIFVKQDKSSVQYIDYHGKRHNAFREI
ncbi:serine hydrolase domain-containing protein [Neobacillus piezotolerans]|uniref:serine hydrolase domain-containing protein n=1 Tax=Neobacillus piezotolerans TaxID=2259171 RepID=UPI0026BFAC7E